MSETEPSAVDQKISIIVTAHNEEHNIVKLLQEIKVIFPPSEVHEIYIAEDGSGDATRAVIQAYYNHDVRVVLSPESPRLGYSEALRRAISNVQGPLILFLDGDGQVSAQAMGDLIKNGLPKRGTILLGVRRYRADSPIRLLFSKSFKILYLILKFPRLADPSSGSIVAHKVDIESICRSKFKLDYGFWWEFQARINNKGVKVIEIPISHQSRSQGKTQIYNFRKIFKLAMSHCNNLFLLKIELLRNRD